jgi:hypothetical protein
LAILSHACSHAPPPPAPLEELLAWLELDELDAVADPVVVAPDDEDVAASPPAPAPVLLAPNIGSSSTSLPQAKTTAPDAAQHKAR